MVVEGVEDKDGWMESEYFSEIVLRIIWPIKVMAVKSENDIALYNCLKSK